jgi:hypothetical protein
MASCIGFLQRFLRSSTSRTAVFVSGGEAVVNPDWETLQLRSVYGGVASAPAMRLEGFRKCLKGTNLPHDFIC